MSEDRPSSTNVVTLAPASPPPNGQVVDALEGLLERAKAGDTRGLLWVRMGANASFSYSVVGEYSLPDLAFALKLAELELDKLVMETED